jgi:hypothetical protein
MYRRGPDEGQVQRAKVLTEDLLEVVRQEYAKVKTLVQQQQMELHQAQVQYAAYSAYAVCILHSYSFFWLCVSAILTVAIATQSWSVFQYA